MTGGLSSFLPCRPRVLRGAPPVPTPPQRHPRRDRATPRLPPSVPSARSSRMPRESLDAPEDLPKESRSQVALGQLEDEVPGMPDQATTGLEQPLLDARHRPPDSRASISAIRFPAESAT